MKVLITGARGMVGTELTQQLASRQIIKEQVSVDIDVRELTQIRDVVLHHKPDIIFHLAAKTDVDWCEAHPDVCNSVNVSGTVNIATVARQVGALLVYPSTFYVYPGERKKPYDERFDMVVPDKIVGAYARSKFAGEQVVRILAGPHIIARFGALFGSWDKEKKFVRKILEQIKMGNREVRLVTDRVIQPSYVKDTVHNLLELIRAGGRGTYNIVGHGRATYFEYGQAVVKFLGRKDVKIIPVSSSEFVERGARTRYLTAMNGHLKEEGLDLMRHWRVTLREYITELREKGVV
jgi:dTDP-4-dehydrorhamnose reductase